MFLCAGCGEGTWAKREGEDGLGGDMLTITMLASSPVGYLVKWLGSTERLDGLGACKTTESSIAILIKTEVT